MPFLDELGEGLVLTAHCPISRDGCFGWAIWLPRDLGEAFVGDVNVLKGGYAGPDHRNFGIAGS